MRLAFLIIALMIFHIANAQVLFQFMPELHGRSLDGLFLTRINSIYQEKKSVRLKISISERKQGPVATIMSQPFEMFPGQNPMSRRIVSGSNISFSETTIGRVAKQSAFFPYGDYEYCFELYNTAEHGGNLLDDQCFSHVLEPLSPLLLAEPADRDRICEKRPMFSWLPLTPSFAGLQYRLTLVALKDGQSATEAIHYNLPIINQSFISTNFLMFPPSVQELKEGGTYVWQVTAYKNDLILTRSEIWTFTVECSEPEAPENPDGFRNIEDLARGNYYVAGNELLFAIHNPYEKRPLNYSIICVSKPGQPVKNLPQLILTRGNNNIRIPLAENKSMRSGDTYILAVEMPDRSTQKLRFTINKNQ